MEEQEERRTATLSEKVDRKERQETSGTEVWGEKHKAGKKVSRASGMARGRLRAAIAVRKKPIIIGVLALVGIAMGLSGSLGLNGMPGFRLHPPMLDSSGEPREHYVEETLPPFFIPLVSTSSERVAIIDFSVVWDGLASVRFKRKELSIRDSLYRYFLQRASEGEDLRDKAPILEAEMSRTFQESVGSKEIEIRIKRVQVL